MTTLHQLRDKLREAKGPSQELDVEIENVFGLALFDTGPWVPGEGHIYEKRLDPKPYTSSIDAAEVLHQRLLPGWLYHGTSMSHEDGTVTHLWGLHPPRTRDVRVHAAPTEALARVLAVVEALIALNEMPGHAAPNFPR